MNGRLARWALIAATGLPILAFAEKEAVKPGGGAGVVEKNRAEKGEERGDPRDKVLDEVHFDSIPLNDVVEYLRDVVPNFKVVLIGVEPGKGEFPKVSIRVKKTSLGQVLQILQQAYGVDVAEIASEREGEGAVTILKVGAPEGDADHAVGSGAGGAALRVYNLQNISYSPPPGSPVGPGAGPTLNDTLSLLKAALAQVEGGAAPVLQVHEATRMLIFKGSAEQRAAIEDVLNAMDPNRGNEQLRIVRDRPDAGAMQMAARERAQRENDKKQLLAARDRVEELEKMVADLKAAMHDQQADSMARMQEVERLKIRLEAALEAERAAKTKAPPAKE